MNAYTAPKPLFQKEVGSFDVKRMGEAMNGEKIKMPKGLTREQKRAFFSEI